MDQTHRPITPRMVRILPRIGETLLPMSELLSTRRHTCGACSARRESDQEGNVEQVSWTVVGEGSAVTDAVDLDEDGARRGAREIGMDDRRLPERFRYGSAGAISWVPPTVGIAVP